MVEVCFYLLDLNVGPVVPRPCLIFAGDGLWDSGHLRQEAGLYVTSP